MVLLEHTDQLGRIHLYRELESLRLHQTEAVAAVMLVQLPPQERAVVLVEARVL